MLALHWLKLIWFNDTSDPFKSVCSQYFHNKAMCLTAFLLPIYQEPIASDDEGSTLEEKEARFGQPHTVHGPCQHLEVKNPIECHLS